MRKRVIIAVIIGIIIILTIILIININKNTEKILIRKTIYNYPNKTTIQIRDNGNIYTSTIIDELTIEGPPKDKFVKTGTISKDDINIIKTIINEMKKETIKNTNFSESYGLSINIGKELLYGGEYFSQESVNKLNEIIQKYY